MVALRLNFEESDTPFKSFQQLVNAAATELYFKKRNSSFSPNATKKDSHSRSTTVTASLKTRQNKAPSRLSLKHFEDYDSCCQNFETRKDLLNAGYQLNTTKEEIHRDFNFFVLSYSNQNHLEKHTPDRIAKQIFDDIKNRKGGLPSLINEACAPLSSFSPNTLKREDGHPISSDTQAYLWHLYNTYLKSSSTPNTSVYSPCHTKIGTDPNIVQKQTHSLIRTLSAESNSSKSTQASSEHHTTTSSKIKKLNSMESECSIITTTSNDELTEPPQEHAYLIDSQLNEYEQELETSELLAALQSADYTTLLSDISDALSWHSAQTNTPLSTLNADTLKTIPLSEKLAYEGNGNSMYRKMTAVKASKTLLEEYSDANPHDAIDVDNPFWGPALSIADILIHYYYSQSRPLEDTYSKLYKFFDYSKLILKLGSFTTKAIGIGQGLHTAGETSALLSTEFASTYDQTVDEFGDALETPFLSLGLATATLSTAKDYIQVYQNYGKMTDNWMKFQNKTLGLGNANLVAELDKYSHDSHMAETKTLLYTAKALGYSAQVILYILALSGSLSTAGLGTFILLTYCLIVPAHLTRLHCANQDAKTIKTKLNLAHSILKLKERLPHLVTESETRLQRLSPKINESDAHALLEKKLGPAIDKTLEQYRSLRYRTATSLRLKQLIFKKILSEHNGLNDFLDTPLGRHISGELKKIDAKNDIEDVETRMSLSTIKDKCDTYSLAQRSSLALNRASEALLPDIQGTISTLDDKINSQVNTVENELFTLRTTVEEQLSSQFLNYCAPLDAQYTSLPSPQETVEAHLKTAFSSTSSQTILEALNTFSHEISTSKTRQKQGYETLYNALDALLGLNQDSPLSIEIKKNKATIYQALYLLNPDLEHIASFGLRRDHASQLVNRALFQHLETKEDTRFAKFTYHYNGLATPRATTSESIEQAKLELGHIQRTLEKASRRYWNAIENPDVIEKYLTFFAETQSAKTIDFQKARKDIGELLSRIKLKAQNAIDEESKKSNKKALLATLKKRLQRYVSEEIHALCNRSTRKEQRACYESFLSTVYTPYFNACIENELDVIDIKDHYFEDVHDTVIHYSKFNIMDWPSQWSSPFVQGKRTRDFSFYDWYTTGKAREFTPYILKDKLSTGDMAALQERAVQRLLKLDACINGRTLDIV